MNRPQLVDPQWQEAATDNAAKGYPWAVWCFDNGRPGCLLDSKQTQAEAERYAETLRGMTRKGRERIVIVCNEGARGPVELSTGRTILHRREPNGSQFAYPAESETLEMTQAEWDEYCEIVRRRKAPKLPKPEPMRQAVLFAGLECLPGQNDLFETDGSA